MLRKAKENNVTEIPNLTSDEAFSLLLTDGLFDGLAADLARPIQINRG